MIPFKLDYVIERATREGACEEQKLLKRLAGVKLSQAEARRELPLVLEHKWLVSERLGRDIGVRVAAADYFENVRVPRAARAESGALTRKLSRAARELAASYLTHQSLKAHDGVLTASSDLSGVSADDIAPRREDERVSLKEWAGVKLSADEAAALWPRVLEHKWFMSERLGRDVGLRVAATDFFNNVRLPRHTRTVRKTRTPRLRRAMQTHGVIA